MLLSTSRMLQSGLSLVELMIAMTLGLLLTVGITTLFVQNNNNFRQNEDFAGMQDAARFAMQLISRDLLMAGYWGGVPNGADIIVDSSATTGSGLLDANSCGPGPNAVASGWAFDFNTPIEFLNQSEIVNINSVYSCITAAELAANTDVLAIRRVSGQPTADVPSGATTATVYEHSFYLKANNVVGTLLKTGAGSTHTLTSAVPPVPNKFWRYTTRIYFVQPYATTVGDGIPTLCRYELQHAAVPSMAKTCLAKGIENLQIEWGVDVSGGGGGQVQYTSLPNSIDNIANALTARISLLVRGTQVDVSHTDKKLVKIGDVSLNAANDMYKRKVYESTVFIRNKPLWN